MGTLRGVNAYRREVPTPVEHPVSSTAPRHQGASAETVIITLPLNHLTYAAGWQHSYSLPIP